jgi:hypothetical protein
VCKALQKKAADFRSECSSEVRWQVQRLQEGKSYELLKDAKHLVKGGKIKECFVPAVFEDKNDNAVAPQAHH